MKKEKRKKRQGESSSDNNTHLTQPKEENGSIEKNTLRCVKTKENSRRFRAKVSINRVHMSQE